VLYGYSGEQLKVLITNIFVSLTRILAFVLIVQELFKLKYVADLLKKFPLIFKSIELVTDLLPKIEIKGKVQIISFLEKLLVKDVFLY
jgi:hypothetical protein